MPVDREPLEETTHYDLIAAFLIFIICIIIAFAQYGKHLDSVVSIQ